MEKTIAADLKSQSTNLTIDMEMASSLEEETIKMLMDIQSDDIMDPLSSHSITKMSMNDPEGKRLKKFLKLTLQKTGSSKRWATLGLSMMIP